VARPLEADDAVDQRKEGVVAAHPDIGPGEDRGAALAKQDGSSVDRLSCAGFHPESLPNTVASVA
jgi:hypothetical protein